MLYLHFVIVIVIVIELEMGIYLDILHLFFSQNDFLNTLKIELEKNADFFKIDNHDLYNKKKYPKIESFL